MRRQTLIDKTNARLIDAAAQLRSYGRWAEFHGYPAMAEQMFRGVTTLKWLTEHTNDKKYCDDAIALLNYLGPKPKKYIRKNPMTTTLPENQSIITTVKELEKVLAPWTGWREYCQAYDRTVVCRRKTSVITR